MSPLRAAPSLSRLRASPGGVYCRQSLIEFPRTDSLTRYLFARCTAAVRAFEPARRPGRRDGRCAVRCPRRCPRRCRTSQTGGPGCRRETAPRHLGGRGEARCGAALRGVRVVRALGAKPRYPRRGRPRPYGVTSPKATRRRARHRDTPRPPSDGPLRQACFPVSNKSLRCRLTMFSS